jgi:probable H4MPT-linked C1 transfer pathway protein
MSWLGLDIGGANLKASDGHAWANSMPFLLWREPGRLSAAIGELIAAAPPQYEGIAITMTGELCDCFRTKRDGVLHIFDAVERAAPTCRVLTYLIDGRLATLDEARRSPQLAAASNWHVLGRFAARFVQGEVGLLIDIGSTTTDLVPLVGGLLHAQGSDDTGRLLAGELVYSGVGRTPVSALTNWLPWRGRRCPIAAEVFATTADAYVMLGELAEEPECTNTADGRPLTRQFSRERLARLICADSTTFTDEDAWAAAERVGGAQFEQLRQAARLVDANLPQRPKSLVVSGAGEFLATKLGRECWPGAKIVLLSEEIGPEESRCAPAHALAILASETAKTFN